MTASEFDGFVTFIYTPDTDRAFRFSEDTLCLPLVHDEGVARVYRVAVGGYLGVCRESAARPCRPEGVCLSLVTDDVDGWYERLCGKGVAPDGQPRELPEYGVYSFFLRDPDGHLIEIQRFADPDWHKA